MLVRFEVNALHDWVRPAAGDRRHRQVLPQRWAPATKHRIVLDPGAGCTVAAGSLENRSGDNQLGCYVQRARRAPTPRKIAMSLSALPTVIEPEALESVLGQEGLLVIDLCKTETYVQYHIPGAVHLDYGRIVHVARPSMGLIPDDEALSGVFSAIGLSPEHHVVAYDDEGGGRACRLLWTLDVLGHRHLSLLNGGLHAWANEGHPLTNEVPAITPGRYAARRSNQAIVASRQYILEHLDDPRVVLLDTRTPEEYSGAKAFAARAGHIPGAVNMDWTLAMDPQRNLRLRAEPELRELLSARGVEADKTVVVYCQTHHRSAHTAVMLKALGYPDVKGYPGSWSDWGNAEDTPVEH